MQVQESNRQKHINNRRQPAARLIQCAWRCYAATLNSTSEATWKQHLKSIRSSIITNNNSNKSRKSFTDMYHHSLDHFHGSKYNVQCSRFNLIEDDDKFSQGGGCISNHNSHNDLTTATTIISSHKPHMLSEVQKNCIRFVRAVKFSLARKAFKNAFRPYDIKDVMQQYSEGHADVVGRVRYMQARINTVQANICGIAKLVQEMQTIQVEKIDYLEQTVRLLVERIDEVITYNNNNHNQNHNHLHHISSSSSIVSSS